MKATTGLGVFLVLMAAALVTAAPVAALETVTIFAGPGCTVPKTVFQLGETVCAQVSNVDGGDVGNIWLQWVAPSGVVAFGSAVTTLVTTTPQNFNLVLPTSGAGAERGLWKAQTATVIGSIPRVAANFRVPRQTVIGVHRDSTSTSFTRNTNTTGFGEGSVIFGQVAGDVRLWGNWFGTGRYTPGFYRPSDGTFHFATSNVSPIDDVNFQFGPTGGQPLAGDWTGDGTTKIGVFLDGVVYLRNTLTAGPADTTFQYGQTGDQAFAGDFDGDGIATIGVYRDNGAGIGVAYLRNSNDTGFAHLFFFYGLLGDIPVTGDWAAEDGMSTIGVYRPSDGTYYLRNSNPANGTGDVAEVVIPFGTVTDKPAPTVRNEAPVVGASGTLNYTEGQAATAIDPAVTVTDMDNATLIGATATIAPCVSPEDQLSFANQNGINGVYADGTCLMTLTGQSSVANYQTALRDVKYRNTSATPNTSARTVTWQVDDGALVNNLSNQPTSGITVTATTPPSFTYVGNSKQFTVGVADSFTISTSGSPTVTNITMASVTPGPGGTLPSGLNFNYVSGPDGTLGGTANNAAHVGTYVVSFTATNGAPPDATSPNFTVTLVCPNVTLGPANNSVFAATFSSPFGQAFSPAGGTTPYTYTLGGDALPSNLAFSGDNLAGTPSNTGTFNFTVKATDANGCASATQNYTLNVNPTVTNDNLTPGPPGASSVIGNVSVDSSLVPFTVVTNDSFPGAATNSVSLVSATGSLGGTMTMTGSGGGMGQFTYDPPRGKTGTDVFNYTLSSNGRTASGTVSITVSGMIWFIDNNPAACASSCDGRQSHPYKLLSDFNAANTGVVPAPQPGDNIFIHTGSTNYLGPLTLRNTQKLLGQGASTALAAMTGLTAGPGQTLPATGGTAPTLATTTAASNTITLASSNTLRGLTLGNVTSTGTALSGTNFGTLTLASGSGGQTADLTINTDGQALNLNTGNIASVFAGITSTGGTNNILLTNVTTSTTSNLGSGALSGATAEALFITGQNGSFTYSGTITNTGGTRAVRIESKTGGTVTLSGNINSGVVGTARGILIQNNNTNTNTIDITGSQKVINTGTGTGVDLATNAGATISFTNGGLAITTTSGTGFSATGATGTVTVNVSGGSNTISTGTGTALNLNATATGVIAGNVALANVTTNGVGAGLTHILLGNVSAPVNIAAGTLAGAPATTRAVDISGGSGNFSYTGTINSGGIRAINRTGTSLVLFDGTAKTLSAGALDGVAFTGNSINSTLTFSNGGLAITTAAGTGFNATSGIVNVTGSSNTITSTSGTALNVSNNTTIGSSDLTFQSISSGTGANSTATGIILDTTGSSGGLHVTGTGSAGTGGTIQHKTGAEGSTTTGIGIYLNSTSDVQLNWMQLNDFQNFGIKGSSVTGFTLANTIINGTNGTTAAGGSEEGAVRFDGLFGSASISNSTLGGTGASDSSFSDNLRLTNSSGTLDRLTISSTNFGKIGSGGNNGLTVSALTSATMNVTVTGSTFTNAIGTVADFTASNSTTMDVVFRSNAISNNNVNQSSGGGGFVLQGGSGATNVTYDISNNTLKDSIGIALLVATGTGGVNWTGTISGNTIGLVDGTPGAAPLTGSTQASGIKVKATGSGTHTVLISNNTVHETNEESIFIQNNDGSAVLNASVFGNTTDTPGPFQSLGGLNVDVGALAADTSVANVIIGSATLASAKNDFSAGDRFNACDVNFSTIGGGVINLSKAGSASGTVAGVIDDDNLNPGTTNTCVAATVNLITANTVRLIASPKSTLEDGSTNFAFTFLRYGDTSAAQTVNFTVGGTAVFNTDYTQSGAATFSAGSGTVTFPAGSGVATITIDPTADGTVETNDTVTLTLAAGGGYTVASPSTATLTILNDD